MASAISEPAWGQVRVAHELHQRGHAVSATGVRCVWQRHDRETLPQRLRALAAKSAHAGRVLSESQLAVREKGKADKEAQGEFESGPQKFVVPLFRFQKSVGPTENHVGADNVTGTPQYFFISRVGTIPGSK